MEPADLGFGFREYWRTAYERYSGFFDEAAQIEVLVRKLNDAPINPAVLQEKRQLIIVVRSLSLTVGNSLGAVVLLVGNGYGQDALRVARSMLEAAIIVKYLIAVPEKVTSYIDYTWIEMNRQVEMIKKFSPKGYATISEESLQELTERYNKAKKHFAKQSGNSVYSSWAKGVSLAQMAQKAGMTEAYDVYYRHASSVVHSDVQSVASAVEPDTLAIRFAPNDSGDARIASYLARATAIEVLRQFNTVAELSFAEEIELRATRQQEAWGAGNKSKSPRVAKSGTVQVSVDVTNTGRRAGDEVVQLYVKHLASKVERPRAELKAFQRVTVQPNETKTVDLSVPVSRLAYWDTKLQAFQVEAEPISVMIGESSASAALSTTVQVQ